MVPLSLWILLAASMMTLGGFLGYGGLRIIEAGQAQLGASLIVLGAVFLVWGSVVLGRCRAQV